MLFIFHYTNLNTSRIETYTLFKRNNLNYEVIISIPEYPFDIINTSFENIDILLKRLGLIHHISIFLGYNNELHPYYLKYNINTQLELINLIESYDFCKEKTKKGRFFKVNFYKKNVQKNQEDLIKEKAFLLENKEINSQGLILEINIYKEKLLMGIFYKKSIRKELFKFDVKNLDFIGRTSMKVENCILVTNLTNACANKIVYDPFCGSGSLLNIFAYFGCKVLGSDLNKHEMIGKNAQKGKIRTLLKGFNVYSNFEKYNLSKNLIAFLQSDINNSPLNYSDYIVTDIPYGVRIHMKNEVYFYIESLFKLAKRILPTKGILAFFSPSVLIQEKGFILLNKVDEKLGTVSRSLYIFEKI